MKRKLLTFGIATLFLSGLALFTSCGNSQTNDEQNEQDSIEQQKMSDEHMMDNKDEMDQTAAMYACPMHPEITGSEGDECSKCGMPLEKVEKSQTADLYACPMHPEITGNEGDKCSKCGMDLEKKKADTDEEESHEGHNH
ncbi:MAG: heavy metal-binding domain-containing protein [Bacteroidales bacterium]|nr:heavy metal-binding domain-containing protein [Bacteroidales bacterium]